VDRDAATRNGSLCSARQAATSYACEEIGPAAASSLGESSARGDAAHAPIYVHDAEPEWRRHPIAQFPGNRTAVSLRCAIAAGTGSCAATAWIAGRLVVETHDARWRFSASATAGPLAGSDVAR
jgi:hypothetical protein